MDYLSSKIEGMPVSQKFSEGKEAETFLDDDKESAWNDLKKTGFIRLRGRPRPSGRG